VVLEQTRKQKKCSDVLRPRHDSISDGARIFGRRGHGESSRSPAALKIKDFGLKIWRFGSKYFGNEDVTH
jgi:hypothetical protein